MNAALIYPFIIVAGVLQAFGAPMNAKLNAAVQNPLLASTISFGLVTMFFIAAFAIAPKPLPTAESLRTMPWWAPVGGLVGAFAVYAGLVFVQKVGAGPFTGLTITAALITSLAIDHFGLFDMKVHAINLWRVLGAALMVGGIALIAKF